MKAYAKAQGMYRTNLVRSGVHRRDELELGSVEPSLAGPKRPQDRVLLKEVKNGFATAMDKEFSKAPRSPSASRFRDASMTSVTATS